MRQIQYLISNGRIIAKGTALNAPADPTTVAMVTITDPVEDAKLDQSGAKTYNAQTGVITVSSVPTIMQRLPNVRAPLTLKDSKGTEIPNIRSLTIQGGTLTDQGSGNATYTPDTPTQPDIDSNLA